MRRTRFSVCQIRQNKRRSQVLIGTMKVKDGFLGVTKNSIFSTSNWTPRLLWNLQANIFWTITCGTCDGIPPRLIYASFPIFRRSGVAFWDSRRLMGLELLGPFEEDGFAPDRNNHFKYLVYLSLRIRGFLSQRLQVNLHDITKYNAELLK